jgi:GTP-binding protein HflX
MGDGKAPRDEEHALFRELESLAETLGLEVAGREELRIREPHPRYGMGKGKAAELAEKAAALGVDCIIFDRDISPSQQRNWEELTGLSAVDRQELIIQIFAGRAQTREAELQVRLAELSWFLPRLQHKYLNLSRQRGGRYGTRGAGETRLETDRRLVERRIHLLKQELEQLRRQRQTRRRQRERSGIPVAALVGYTNAGKSSVLNALTGAGVLAEDKLFATLDTVSRRLKPDRGKELLLVDTVGFIRRLPPALIEAFHATLEELCLADLLIHVLDASDPGIDQRHETTLSVLRELGAGRVPMITVLNKIDIAESPEYLESLERRYPGSIPVSALTGRGLAELVRAIEEGTGRAH